MSIDKLEKKILSLLKKEFDIFDDTVEKDTGTFLKKCVSQKEFRRALPLSKAVYEYSGPKMVTYLILAAISNAASGNKKMALKLIERARYFGDYKDLKPLLRMSEMASVRDNPYFLELTAPARPKKFLQEDLADAISMWKNDDYDNLKDAIIAAKDLQKDASKSDPKLNVAAKKHLESVMKEALKRAAKDPKIKSYLKNLI